jgi:hypothetical protein
LSSLVVQSDVYGRIGRSVVVNFGREVLMTKASDDWRERNPSFMLFIFRSPVWFEQISSWTISTTFYIYTGQTNLIHNYNAR